MNEPDKIKTLNFYLSYIDIYIIFFIIINEF
jgi:hypothetical protein